MYVRADFLFNFMQIQTSKWKAALLRRHTIHV